MKTGSKTTYILLERGEEDLKLYLELEEELGHFLTEDYSYTTHPTLRRLYDGLRQELEGQGIAP